MNHEYWKELERYSGIGGIEWAILKNKNGIKILADRELVAIIHNGTLYHNNKVNPNKIPVTFWDDRKRESIPLGVNKRKLVKYIQDFMPLISDLAKKNKDEYPTLVQRIKVRNMPLTVRSRPEGKRTEFAIFNEDGLRVASAQDEWGATLIVVAKEYRGMGLGKIVGKYWYNANPTAESGGFTPQGEANAIKIWADRVREFLAKGWYTELIRQKRLTMSEYQKIVKDLPGKKPKPPEPPKPKPVQKEILFYVEYPTFVIYDKAFLTDQNDEYIYAYGFFRDSPHVGSFLYTIDYDRKFRKMATWTALQMARDEGEKTYDGEGYSDVLELEGVDHVVREGDYVWLDRNVLPLKSLSQKERRLRKKVDRYGEIENLLLEGAEYKKW
jgi:hypothetical protein